VRRIHHNLVTAVLAACLLLQILGAAWAAPDACCADGCRDKAICVMVLSACLGCSAPAGSASATSGADFARQPAGFRPVYTDHGMASRTPREIWRPPILRG
jgi:hypothetical protein